MSLFRRICGLPVRGHYPQNAAAIHMRNYTSIIIVTSDHKLHFERIKSNNVVTFERFDAGTAFPFNSTTYSLKKL
jgi:hypothetical protein